MSRTEHLVSVPELASSAVLLLDVRWHLTDAPGDGRRRYARGHLPGARFLDLEEVLTAHTGNPRDGRHPLPDVPTLTAGLEALGVTAEDDLVVYDEPGSYAAERAWWVLRWAGLRTRVLDGGIEAWTQAGKPLEEGDPVAVTPSRLHLTVGRLPTIDADEAADLTAAGGVLVDGRAPERYRGETEPLDPRPGHVPGAVNVPAAALYEAGRMPADDDLRARLAVALDGDPGREVAAYCGSGVSAARDVLALAVLGVPASLYPGSWSAWSNDPARPAALGPEPGGRTLDSSP
ncbi:MAG TPA: sulfurtransferase [Lapillicoccus sp.]|nr:sulfurtransferase [Lapillicoccus sp.]